MKDEKPNIQAEQVEFENGKKARLVRASQDDSVAAVAARLDLPHLDGVILLCGGAESLDPQAERRLELLFDRGVRRAAVQSKAVIIDGGTHSGVMALMGEAVADQEDHLALIGVAPQGKVRYPGMPETPLSSVTSAGDSASHSASDSAHERGRGTRLDCNHTHFVLVEGNTWGSETRLMFALAEYLSEHPGGGEAEQRPGIEAGAAKGAGAGKKSAASKEPPKHAPVVMILAGGNSRGVASKEVRQAVRRGWPVIVLEGSGGLADALAGSLRNNKAQPRDGSLAEILEEGNLHLSPMSHSAGMLHQQVLWHLGKNELLTLAWKRYGAYSTQAKRHRQRFQRIQKLILWLGVITTLFVVIKTALQVPGWADVLPYLSAGARLTLAEAARSLDPLLYIVVLVLPIFTSAVIAVAARLNAGNKWVLLRSSAEAVKRQIYLYRTLPMVSGFPPAEAAGDEAQDDVALLVEVPPAEVEPDEPNPSEAGVAALKIDAGAAEVPSDSGLKPQTEQMSREEELYRRLEQVDQELLQSDVVTSAMPEYYGRVPPISIVRRGDDGRSLLTPQRYIYLRLDEQLDYYRGASVRLEQQGQRLQWWAIAAGALGTFLAAIGLELWVALTTAIVTALTAYLQYEQTENTLVRYNHAASSLDNIKLWWESLPADEKADPQNVRRLVEASEHILEGETRSWLQQMRDALADLSKRPSADYSGNKPPEG